MKEQPLPEPRASLSPLSGAHFMATAATKASGRLPGPTRPPARSLCPQRLWGCQRAQVSWSGASSCWEKQDSQPREAPQEPTVTGRAGPALCGCLHLEQRLQTYSQGSPACQNTPACEQGP